MGLLDRFRKPKEDTEADRRAVLLRSGRIAEGSILDIGTDPTGITTHIFYHYSAGGVDYESSQLLDEGQRDRPEDYTPGARVTIKYDPRNPGNSLVV